MDWNQLGLATGKPFLTQEDPRSIPLAVWLGSLSEHVGDIQANSETDKLINDIISDENIASNNASNHLLFMEQGERGLVSAVQGLKRL